MPRDFVDCVRDYQTKQYWGAEDSGPNLMKTRSGLPFGKTDLAGASGNCGSGDNCTILDSQSSEKKELQRPKSKVTLSTHDLPFVTRCELIDKENVCDFTHDMQWLDKDMEHYEKDRRFMTEMNEMKEASQGIMDFPNSFMSTVNPIPEATQECDVITEPQNSSESSNLVIHEVEEEIITTNEPPQEVGIFSNFVGENASPEKKCVVLPNPCELYANNNYDFTSIGNNEILCSLADSTNVTIPTPSEPAYSIRNTDNNSNPIIGPSTTTVTEVNTSNLPINSSPLQQTFQLDKNVKASPTFVLQMPQESYTNPEYVTSHVNNAMKMLPKFMIQKTPEPIVICVDFTDQSANSPCIMIPKQESESPVHKFLNKVGEKSATAQSPDDEATKNKPEIMDTNEAAQALMVMARNQHQPSPIKKDAQRLLDEIPIPQSALCIQPSTSTPMQKSRLVAFKQSPIQSKISPKPVIIQKSRNGASQSIVLPSTILNPETGQPDPAQLAEYYTMLHTSNKDINGQTVHQCIMCNKVFVSYYAFKLHANTHLKQKNQCSVCGKLFSRSWLLKGHLRTHTGEKPYKCTFEGCERAFADRSNLRSHKLIHCAPNGDEFKCPKCKRVFAQKRYLNKHMQEVCKSVD